MRIHGEKMQDVTIAEKILRYLTEQFNYIVCSIEESKDTHTLYVDELQSLLIVHEQKFHKSRGEEQALQVTIQENGEFGGKTNEASEEEGEEDIIGIHLNISNVTILSTTRMNTLDEIKKLIIYGHLSLKGLQVLENKEMVKGLPHLSSTIEVCTNCMKGNQHRDSIPKKSQWRVKEKLELIHADICGPITPASNNNERDKKTTYHCLYSPKNGVAERKNRTIINMVRSLLCGKGVPITFWPEAINWSIYILNRSPTLDVKNKTSEEAWSDCKPSVSYIKIFGCIGHVHIPDAKRTKLENKSCKCILLGTSDESKGYRGETDSDLETKSDSDTSEGESLEINVEEFEHNVAENHELNKNASRVRRPSIWLNDYENGQGLLEEEEEANMADIDNANLYCYEAVVNNAKWRQAMDVEITAIENNKTRALTNLPKGSKKIGDKLTYKTKLNELGQLDKYKARLGAKRKFQASKSEKTLFLKHDNNGGILIVSIYVDDLIYTGNNEKMRIELRNSMKKEFATIDLGKMKYFLGMEVIQGVKGVYFNQRKYAIEKLERFDMSNINAVKVPIVPSSKIDND
ncbi:uncharacterized protein [Cicer arietinum]|uniref:uncharacterized protein n=1 Tax=Cicer arietinum TaxID=3827 RepID=UPI003CC66419